MKYNGDTFNLAIDENGIKILFSDDNRTIIVTNKDRRVIAEITCHAIQNDSFLLLKDLTNG